MTRLRPDGFAGQVVTFPAARESRADLVARMAADLVKYDAWRNKDDALRSLVFGCRYPSFEAVMYLDDVRQAAMQMVVAREMSAS